MHQLHPLKLDDGTNRECTRLRVVNPAFFVPVAFALFLVITVLRSSSSTDSSFNIPATIHDLHDSVDKLVSAGTSFTSGRKGEPDEWSRNPFEEKGRLIVDLEVPIRNRWVPYDKTCKPSTYLNSLWRVENDDTPLIPVNDPSLAEELRLKSVGGNREFLPWLMNRTIVIHGDSIDRFHLKDFCSLVNGRLFVVSPDHPASPPPYHRSHVKQLGTNSKETKQSKAEQKARAEKERAWDARPMDGIELTNPWVCDIEEYGTTLVSVFTWGLEGAEEFFGSERWYYPPATWTERLEWITKPLLEGLATYLNRPEIIHPDLIEINSGYWDLRKFTEEDFTAAGWTARPYPEDSEIPYSNLSPEREAKWEHEARKAIKKAARSFRGKDGSVRSGPTLLWRALHAPPARHNYAPFPRVSALDALSQKILGDLKAEYTPSQAGGLHRHVVDEEEGSLTEDLGLDERLRLNVAGHLLHGQEHHFRDLLHPASLPGSYLWGDVILYELKRAVLKVGRSWAQER